MEISNPRRILVVSLADSAELLSNVIRDLTGSDPTPASSSTASLAGTTHDLVLATAYYRATVPVWLDLADDAEAWAASFLSDEAREVRDALGAVVVVFPVVARRGGEKEGEKEQRRLVDGVGRVVREGLGGWEWDGVALGVGVGDVDVNDGLGEEVLDGWEDACAEWGMEFVHVPAAARGPAVGGGNEETRNEFGEKTGIPRVLEALQANDWSQTDALDGDFFDDDEGGAAGGAVGSGLGATEKDKGGDGDADEDAELDPESLDFGFDREDFVGLRKAIWSTAGEEDEEFMDKPGVASKGKAPNGGGGEEEGDESLGEEDVQELEGMMKKLLAVRDMSAGLPEEQRKRMAKKAVVEVMKDL